MTDSKKKINTGLIVAIAVVAIVLVVGGVLAFGGKGKNEPKPNDNVTKTEDNKTGVKDGDITFSVDAGQTRVQVPEISDGSVVTRKAGDGKQFVLVLVEAKNETSEEKSLYASDQVLITKNGERVKADAGVQTFVENGSWYEKIPAKGKTSGTLVFEISADDRIKEIELHGGLATKGAVIQLD